MTSWGADARRALWHSAAWRDVWPVFFVSRLLVFAVAALAVAVIGDEPVADRREAPLGYMHPFDSWPLGGALDAVLTPLANFDSVWYLAIAQDGYEPETLPGNAGSKYAFFPLYPLLVRVASVTGSAATTMIAAYVVSAVACLVALLLLHRLTTLELGSRYARTAVLLMAFAPVSYLLSAPYTESLYLALTLGAFVAARERRWALAGLLAAASSATRNTGVLIVIPLVLMYINDLPREDRWRWRPRADALWIALAPAGLIAFSAYLAVVAGDPLAWRESQDVFGRVTMTPFEGAWEGLRAGVEALGPERSGEFARLNVYNLLWLLFAVVGLVGVFRRLPLAYGAWATAALLVPLSAPFPEEPLRSIPRFVLVLFPIWMWLATVCERRRGLTWAVTAVSAVGLVGLTAAFATWQQVV